MTQLRRPQGGPPGGTGRRRRPNEPAWNITRRTRLMLIGGIAAAALTAGLVSGAGHVDSDRALLERFAAAWETSDYAAMHGALAPSERAEHPVGEFAAAYQRAAQTLTLAALRTGEPRRLTATGWELPVEFETRLFGSLEGRLRLAVDDGGTGMAWAPHQVFPGLPAGMALSREVLPAERGDILARDGTALAGGTDRISALGGVAADVTGRVGAASGERAARLAERGLPADSAVGLSGLELHFDARLGGRPGGRLLAGGREIARRAPRAGRDVRTTIDPEMQTAAVEALAGRYGGAVAIDPATGEVLALAGIATSAPQPPGSIFKIVTLAAALTHDEVGRDEVFPRETATTLSGVRLENADGEVCGGSLRESFAHSCNSVFAPLGVRVGASRLVEMAERFGFNEPAPFAFAQPSTMPAAEGIGDDLALGSTAIGQGRLLATTLQAAVLSATIATGGSRRPVALELGARGDAIKVIEPAVARTIAAYMREVVTSGTGTAAAIPGSGVAGKTGTAELRSTVTEPGAGGFEPAPIDDPTDTDAWFTAFAPRSAPRVAVAVLLVGHGTGGATAAPAARVLLAAALKR